MRARGAWVLLLLAAVFLMHGPPSMAAPASPAAGAAAGASSAVAAPHAGAELLPGTAAPLEHRAVVTLDGDPREHGAPAHTAAGHAWAACLAVLLAGLALLGALILARRLRPVLRDLTAGPPRTARAWLRLPRPPDLATLCVLRT